MEFRALGDLDDQKVVGLPVFIHAFQGFRFDKDRGFAEIKGDAQDFIDVLGIVINSCNFTVIFNSND